MHPNFKKLAFPIVLLLSTSSTAYAKASVEEKPKEQDAVCIGWNSKGGCIGIYIDDK